MTMRKNLVNRIEDFIRRHKKISLLVILTLIATILNLIVILLYPQVRPISNDYIEAILPPELYWVYMIAQFLIFAVIFLAGYFFAEYRISKSQKAIIEEDKKNTKEDIDMQEDLGVIDNQD